MLAYKDCSINTKLTWLAVVTSGTALLLSCLTFVCNHLHKSTWYMLEDVSTLAQVVGSTSSAALRFDDPEAAAQQLSALRLDASVESACLYDAKGRRLATYMKKGARGADLPDAPPPLGDVFGDGYLNVVQEVVDQDETVGTIYLRCNMDAVHKEAIQYLMIAALVMAASFIAAMALSQRLQKAISVPILELAQTAQRISVEGDYSLRVRKNGNDELGTLFDEFNAMLGQIESAKQDLQAAHNQLEARVNDRTRQLSQANLDLSREIAERRRAEEELAAAQQQLIESARRSGMAEIATGVLHNVGNVLNSVNVSATLVVDRLAQSKVDQLVRAANLLQEHRDDLGRFVTEDPKGRNFANFLKLVASHMIDERDDIMRELNSLTGKVEHIKTIVSTQQSYAGTYGVVENVDVGEALEDAIKLNSASLEKHSIRIVKEYAELPKVRIDKHRLIQILVNLVKNAKDALSEIQEGPRDLIVRTTVNPENRLVIQLTDSGIGIPAENLTRIFSHGFTTKQTGHGFGLHSCANAAREMGGSLSASSHGTGCGATFTLEFPFQPVEALETMA